MVKTILLDGSILNCADRFCKIGAKAQVLAQTSLRFCLEFEDPSYSQRYQFNRN